MRKGAFDCYLRGMTTRRFALKIRVGEMMEILDGIRGQGVAGVVAAHSSHAIFIHDVESIYFSLDNLGDKISIKSFTLGDLETEYEAVRKNLLALVTRMAQISIAVTGPQTAVNMYDYAVRV
jgi:hypothetical protein